MSRPLRIAHIGLWAQDPELLRDFYCRWFGLDSGGRYHNPKTGFSSYFLAGDDGDCALELMHRDDVAAADFAADGAKAVRAGLAHVAFRLDDESAVEDLVRDWREAGVSVIDGPRRTGDGFYEAVALDPEGNRIEISAF